MMNWQDPLRSQRIQIEEQERKHREEKGIYKAPPFLLWGFFTVIALLLAVVILLYLFR